MEYEACKQIVYSGYLLKCMRCSGKYHYACLNMQTAYFMGHKSDLEKSWRCDQCKNITLRRRIRNDDSPTRKQFEAQTKATGTTPPEKIYVEDGPNNLEQSPKENQPPKKDPPKTLKAEMITLQQFSSLLDSRFENFRSIIRQDIANELEARIGKITVEFTKKIEIQEIEQQSLQGKILEVTNTISNIEKSLVDMKDNTNNQCPTGLNQQLQEEFTLLRDEIYKETNEKKVVLYGLDEYWDESEHQIIGRINHAFHELLSIDINGYIESVSRIGKKGYRRPIIIELISKRMIN